MNLGGGNENYILLWIGFVVGSDCEFYNNYWKVWNNSCKFVLSMVIILDLV